MSGRLYVTQFTVPAGTPVAAPVSSPVQLEDAILDRVTVIIPDGHALLTGVAVQWSGAPLIPFGPGTWLSGNNEPINFDIAGEITAAGLSVVGYNLDVFAHSFLFRWFISDIPAQLSVNISSPQAAGPSPATTAGVGDLAVAAAIVGSTGQAA